MAKYITREMADMDGSGNKRIYYKVQTYRNISTKELIERICAPGSGVNSGDVAKVMLRLIEELKLTLAEGYSVTLDELGTFSLSIGKNTNIDDSENDDETKTNSRNDIVVKGVNFRPNKQFTKDVGEICKLQKGYESPINRSPFSKEERIQMAKDFINENGFIRVPDYQTLTHLPHSTAAVELKEISQDEANGISAIGRGNTRMYRKIQ